MTCSRQAQLQEMPGSGSNWPLRQSRVRPPHILLPGAPALGGFGRPHRTFCKIRALRCGPNLR